MTTAEGGANFSRHTPAPGAWLANDERFMAQYGVSRLITLHQVHSADVVEVTPANRSALDGVSADGLFTVLNNTALGILTADCYPVLIAGKKAVAALHCGWRGTVKGIVAKTAALFDKTGDSMEYAYIGAGISAASFEVRQDFLEDVSAWLDPSPYVAARNGSYTFDLRQLIIDQLNAAGAALVETTELCTYTDNRFYSYRRDKNTGRMLSVVERV